LNRTKCALIISKLAFDKLSAENIWRCNTLKTGETENMMISKKGEITRRKKRKTSSWKLAE
jgi:hypothetical protein